MDFYTIIPFYIYFIHFLFTILISEISHALISAKSAVGILPLLIRIWFIVLLRDSEDPDLLFSSE